MRATLGPPIETLRWPKTQTMCGPCKGCQYLRAAARSIMLLVTPRIGFTLQQKPHADARCP
eukprot:39900-Eustigmatos_ZCMA.PRE.1